MVSKLKRFLILAVSLTILVNLQAQNQMLENLYLSNDAFKQKLSRWLDAYKLKISDFKFDSEGDLSFFEESGSAYKRDFDDEQLTYDPILNEYSPNKKRYVDLMAVKGVYYESSDQRYHYGGGDDCQEIYFTDLDLKINKLIKWNGVSFNSEDVFWVNDDIFILVSIDDYDSKFYIQVFNIMKDQQIFRMYTYSTASKSLEGSFDYFDIILKEKNIIDSI